MTATITAPTVAALHSVDTSTDTARVWVDTATPDRAALKVAAKVAAGALHTIVGKPLTITPGDGGAFVVFPAIRTRRTSTAAPVTFTAPAPKRERVTTSTTSADALAAQIADLQRQLAALTPEAPKAPREVPAFIAKARAITCRTCRDHGVVRGVGSRAGQAYRTADGAAAAKVAGRAVKCPSHKRAPRAA